ncbi:peptidylprolyl isomerase [Cohnella silvisoli]|uniref:peptidylprolyl isomerase n=1 Tax=Cohnella silvisoli TaxID=2873699 RepID=A0ABV1KSG7_9BACL|nr:peptidylprolyl isomerase [Cohnella silvisoli]MCD9021308.1 peptidylprolyl isomerase [Cohnella silvisoli]
MSERKENELNDNEQLTNEEIEKEINESEVVENDVFENEEIEKELDEQEQREVIAGVVPSGETTNYSTPPSAPARNTGAMIAPWVITAIAIIALVFVLVRNPSGGSLDEVVGKMDGITLKKSDMLAEMTKPMSNEQQSALVDNIAELKLIDSESEKAGIAVTDEDVKKEIENIKKANNITTDEDLTAALQQSGMTLESFKEKLKTQLKFKKLYEKQNPVTDNDLKTYFDKNKENFATTPKEVKASHILLKTKEEAEAVLTDLKAGKDFAMLAKEKSQDPGSKDNGGDLGFFPRGKMNTGFETAAFALAKGQMSEVVEAESGFHIIKVTDIKEAVIPAYDGLKDQVKEAFYNEKLQTEGQTWIEKMKKDKNYKNLLKKEPEPTASASPSASPAAK